MLLLLVSYVVMDLHFHLLLLLSVISRGWLYILRLPFSDSRFQTQVLGHARHTLHP